MRPINRKLLREAWRLRGQMISIALVVASGIMSVVTMGGAYQSLFQAREQYYRDYRLADVWAGLKRAPQSLRDNLAAIPGVTAVETRVTFAASLDLPEVDAPVLGRFISMPVRRRPLLNDIHLTAGRYLAPGRVDEAVVGKNFAAAHGFAPGDTLHALINGRRRALTIVGMAMSPEHSYTVPPGALYPDDERYGIIWMSNDVLAPVYDMDGAFNEVALRLAPGASQAAVLAAVDRLLEPYGGLGAYGRDRQLSAKILDDELKQNRVSGRVVPAVFLAVAAFLLHMVLGRLIATQRTEIAVLKAFGYSNREVGWHYLQFALVAGLAGAVVGVGLGVVLGHSMLQVYREYFDFPVLEFASSLGLVAIGVGVSLLAATLGAVGAVRRAVALPPAEAMRPEPPARFEPGWIERTGLGRLLPTVGRFILRNVERQPVKALLSAAGVAFSVSILVIGMSMFDAVTHMMDLQFRLAQREDLSVTFIHPLSPAVGHEIAGLEGVRRTELFRSAGARLRAGAIARDVGITGLAPDSRLRRIITSRGGVQPVPPSGLVLSALLAEQLRVGPGDSLEVKMLEGRRRTVTVAVSGVVEDFIGLAAYMNLDALHRMAGDGPVVSGAYLTAGAAGAGVLNARLKELPAVASVAAPAQMLASFEEQMARGIYIGAAFLLGFSGIIAVAVIYNGARIALSERGRELASLRVLGFTRGEVSVMLLGEQAIITLLAIPLGWGLGYLMAAGVARAMRSETFRIPVVVSPSTYLYAAGLVAVAAALSATLVRRRLNRLDLVAVLKTRE